MVVLRTRLWLVFVLFVPLLSCANGALDPHENFKKSLQAQVGKGADDPDTAPGRLYSNRIGERTLANGNVEIGFRHFRTCRYYYEIDKATRKIVAARYEGTKDECFLTP